MPRCRVVNARPNIQELDRIRRDIGARLRTEYAVAEPAPQSLVALRKELETLSETLNSRSASRKSMNGWRSSCTPSAGSFAIGAT
jgi:hypothetical protein